MDTTITTETAATESGIGKIYISANPREDDSKVKAFADLNYAGMVLKGLRVIHGANGLFVAPPSEKRNDKWQNHYYFGDRALREKISTAILSEYHRSVRGQAAPAPRSSQN